MNLYWVTKSDNISLLFYLTLTYIVIMFIDHVLQESSLCIAGRPLEGSDIAELARAVTVATTDSSQAISPRGNLNGRQT